MTRQIDQNAWMSSLNVDYMCIVGVWHSLLYMASVCASNCWLLACMWMLHGIYINVRLIALQSKCANDHAVEFSTELLISVTIGARQCVKLGPSAFATLVCIVLMWPVLHIFIVVNH